MSNVFAFHLAQTPPQDEIELLEGEYSPEDQVWIGENGALAACTYKNCYVCTSNPFNGCGSQDYTCDRTDNTGPGVCDWC